MLDFVDIFQKRGVPKGVVHCGAQLFHFRGLYLSFGLTNTVWVESEPFFYNFGLESITGTDEKLFDWKLDSVNTISSYFDKEKLSLKNYNYLHLSISNFIIPGLDIYQNDISNFKFVSIEATNNIGDKHTDLKVVKRWFKSKGFKLIKENSVENLAHLFFEKKRNYKKSIRTHQIE